MERRRYLASLAAVVGAVTAGCGGGDLGDGGSAVTESPTMTRSGLEARPTEGPTPTRDTPTGTVPGVAVADSMTGWERRHYPVPSEDADDPPNVEFDPGNDRLFVRGVVLVGSSSCNEAAVHGIGYEEGELRVYVLPGRKESVRDETPRECTSDMSADAYEVAAWFDDGLPERVVAREGDAEAEERRTVYER